MRAISRSFQVRKEATICLAQTPIGRPKHSKKGSKFDRALRILARREYTTQFRVRRNHEELFVLDLRRGNFRVRHVRRAFDASSGFEFASAATRGEADRRRGICCDAAHANYCQ